MNREDEICLVLQGLINGIDYDTGEVVEFSDKVKDSLKVIAASFKCRERSQQISDIPESEQPKYRNYMVNGTFKEIVKTIKSTRPNHLVIIQNGYFYETLDEDATFFANRFSYNTFDWRGTTKTGFPIHSKKVLSNLREMKKPFVVVSQLPSGKHKKVLRAISDIFDVNKIKSIARNCIKCGVEIPKSVIEEFQYREDCNACMQERLSKFEVTPPKDNKFIPAKNRVKKVEDDDLLGINNPCTDCECEIPQARLELIPNTIRCASCQSKFEKSHPDSVARKIKEEGILTREGAKSMRAKQYGTNIHNKI